MSVVDGGGEGPLADATGQWVLLTEDRICIYGGVGDPVENLIWSTISSISKMEVRDLLCCVRRSDCASRT